MRSASDAGRPTKGSEHDERPVSEPLPCWVYRGRKKADAYLFVPRAGDFSRVPGPLREAMGALQLALELDLHPPRRLARTDTATVAVSLRERGYYLQLPEVE